MSTKAPAAAREDPALPKPEASEAPEAPDPPRSNGKRASTLNGLGPAPRLSSDPPPASSRMVDPRRSGAPKSIRGRAAQRYRFFRAYWTTFLVIGSYLWFGAMSRLLGQTWADNHVAEVHTRNARRVERTICQLQGLFIKVGQLLSIMANFLPAQFRSGLEGLQDQVPPRPYSEIEDRIQRELGKPVDALFDRFARSPIASASLGQVHEAWLKDGTHVAVKVQHRDIDEIVRLDLITIRRIMAIVTLFIPVQGIDAYYHQIRLMISEELDFLREARNIARISANFTRQPNVQFPLPQEALCTRRVMVTTFVEGVKVGDVAAMDARGIDRRELAKRIVRVFCQQIFVDGVYHADPHPGNILVQKDGSLVLLDFGAVAELSPQMRDGIPEFLEGVLRKDTDKLIKAMRKMGFLSRTSDERVSEKIIDYFHRRFQEDVKLESFNLKDIKIDPARGFENLLDLRKMNIGLKELSGAFHIPKDWVLLERTIILLYGCCSMLDPELEPMSIIQPYLQDFVLGSRDWQEMVMETVREMALSAVTLPDDLKKYLNRATRGEMEVRVRGMSEGARTVYAAGRQLIYTSIGIACGLAALQLHMHGDDALARWPIGGAIACGVFLLVSSIFSRPRSEP